MSETADYLLKLYRLRLDKGDFHQAASLVKILSNHLPPPQIKCLQNEIRTGPIRAFLAERQVEHLVHFTQLSNVNSILKYGLLPRDHLEKLSKAQGFTFAANDQLRLDNHRDASCLSISFPNHQMFYVMRQEAGNNVTWVVLLLRPDLLWQKDCAYVPTNAADRFVRNKPIMQLKTLAALHCLFEDFQAESTCKYRPGGLAPFLTTNPQAEVLVFEEIGPEYIQAICLPSDYIKPACEQSLWPEIEVRIEPIYFGPRADHYNWSRQNIGQAE